MSIDIQVFIETLIDEEWVLVDIDPIHSAERSSHRRNRICELDENRPSNLSKGVKYWLSLPDADQHVYVFSLREAVNLWTDESGLLDEIKFSSAVLSCFGLWQPCEGNWRIVVTF